jgi:hypothetical protein
MKTGASMNARCGSCSSMSAMSALPISSARRPRSLNFPAAPSTPRAPRAEVDERVAVEQCPAERGDRRIEAEHLHADLRGGGPSSTSRLLPDSM